MGLLDTLKNLFGGGTAETPAQPMPEVQPQPEMPEVPTSDEADAGADADTSEV